MRLKFSILLSLAIVFCSQLPAHASLFAGWESRAPGVEWGGAGGGPNSKTCPFGYVAVGVTSSPNTSGIKYLYGFGFVCQKVKVTMVGNLDSLGYEFSLAGAKVNVAMVDTGGVFAQNTSLCGTDRVLVGVQLDSSNGTQEFIQDVAAICEDFPSFGNQTIEPSTRGDNSDNLVSICNQSFVTGFSGRTGEGLDKLGVTCSHLVPVSGPAQSPEPQHPIKVNKSALLKLDSKLSVSIKDLLLKPDGDLSSADIRPEALYFILSKGENTEVNRWGRPALPTWLISNSTLAEVEILSDPEDHVIVSSYEYCMLIIVKGNQTLEINCP
jgi:hypothetical protein